MRPHAYLVLLFALHARAATIQSAPELEKKLPTSPEDTIKDKVPLDNLSSEQELIDSANTIKDVENNLRVKAVDSIPVKVVIDDPNDDDSVDLKRVEIDLNNPGEPQRQEHETQNPIHYEHEQQIVTTVKQTVVDTQAALKQGFQGVTQGIQDWIANNEQLSSIQQSIQGLQQDFNNQITKLNSTIQSYWNNNQDTANTIQPDQKIKPQIDNVEKNLKTLEDNFQIGVKALSEGVQVFATLRQENEKPTTSPPNNLFVQYLSLFQQTISQGFNNVTQAIQNYVSQNNTNNTASNGGILQGINNGIQNILGQGGSPAPPDAQSDEQAQKPTIWQGIQSSIQNILNPAQTQASPAGQANPPPAAPNRPLAQAIQNNPFVQGVVNLIQPNKPGAQQSQPEKPPVQEGSNSVPEPSSDTKPESVPQAPAKVTEPLPQAPNGPIQNIIQNNPIVKGISGAVQRLQSSINSAVNPEKPRDTVKQQEEPATAETKGHGYGGFYGSGGHNGGAGDNNDSSGVATQSEPIKVEKLEGAVPEEPKETISAEKAQTETDKTETTT